MLFCNHCAQLEIEYITFENKQLTKMAKRGELIYSIFAYLNIEKFP